MKLVLLAISCGIALIAQPVLVENAGPVNELSLNITSLGLSSATLNSVVVTCFEGTGFSGGHVTGDLSPITQRLPYLISRSTSSVTARFTRFRTNVACVASSGGGGGGGSGNVTGPNSSTNEYVTVFDGTDGKIIKQNLSGCRISSSAGLQCGDGSAIGAITLLSGTAPSAPSTSGEHTIYVDSSDGRLKSKAVGGAVTDYLHVGEAGGGGGLDITSGNAVFFPWGYPFATTSNSHTNNTSYYVRFVLPYSITIRYLIVLGSQNNTQYVTVAIYDSACDKVANTGARALGEAGGGTTYKVMDLGASGVALSAGIYYFGFATEGGNLISYSLSFATWLNQISGAPDFFTGSNAPTGSGATYAMPSACGTKTPTGTDNGAAVAQLISK